MVGNETSQEYEDRLLDRLNTECAISGALYVALISLWTTAIDKKTDMPQEIMYPVVEAIQQYEKMHIPY